MAPGHERRELEQYFYADNTVRDLCGLADGFGRPCCLCAPTLAAALRRRGRDAALLDVDERFAWLPGYVRWDLRRPRVLNEVFDLVVCDPPFFGVSLRELAVAVRVVCRFDPSTAVAVGYLARRGRALVRALDEFRLSPTGYRPAYRTVQACERNDIEVFANFDSPLWTRADGEDGRC